MNYALFGTPILHYVIVDDEQVLVPATGGEVTFWEAGTVTPKTIYTYNEGTGYVATSNPVILDADGYGDAGGVFLGEGNYKVRLRIPDGTGGWTEVFTVDQVPGAESTTSITASNNIVLSNIATLRDTDVSGYNAVYVLGYYNPGDGGGGWFTWNAGSSTADDNGMIVAPTGAVGPGRSVRRIVGNALYSEYYGVMERPTTEPMVSRITTLNSYASSSGISNIYYSNGSISVQGSFTMVDGVTHHIPEGCVFAGTVTNPTTLTVAGNLDVGKYAFIGSQCFLTLGSGVDVRPEWWVSAGLTQAYAYDSIILDGTYSFSGSSDYGTASVYPHLTIKAGTAIDCGNCTGNIYIGSYTFEDNDSSFCFTDSTGSKAFSFVGNAKKIPASHLNIANQASLVLWQECFTKTGRMTLLWDKTFDFTGAYTEPITAGLTHEFTSGGYLDLNGYAVSVVAFKPFAIRCLSKEGTFKYNVGPSSVSPDWFGAVAGDSTGNYKDHLDASVRCSVASGIKLSGSGKYYVAGSYLAISSVCNIDGLSIQGDSSGTVVSITGGGVINGLNIGGIGKLSITSNTDRLKITNSKLFATDITTPGADVELYDNEMYFSDLVVINPSMNVLVKVSRNNFTDGSSCRLLATSSSIRSSIIEDNNFLSGDVTIDDNGQTGIVVQNVSIRRNKFRSVSTSSTPVYKINVAGSVIGIYQNSTSQNFIIEGNQGFDSATQEVRVRNTVGENVTYYEQIVTSPGTLTGSRVVNLDYIFVLPFTTPKLLVTSSTSYSNNGGSAVYPNASANFVSSMRYWNMNQAYTGTHPTSHPVTYDYSLSHTETSMTLSVNTRFKWNFSYSSLNLGNTWG